jgi:transposase-like protein
METKPQKPSSEKKQSPQNFVNHIRHKTRRIFPSEQKILIVMEALRGEDSLAAICRKHGTRISVLQLERQRSWKPAKSAEPGPLLVNPLRMKSPLSGRKTES